MREPTPDPELGLQRLAALARHAGAREVPDAWRQRVLAEIEHRASRRAAPRWSSPRARTFALIAASLAALAIAGALLFFRAEAPLAYSVTSTPDSAPGYVRGGPDGATARFGDGTVIGFAPEARGRVVAVTARGARVNVDQGKAHFRVVHLPRAEWTVEAGPFTIAVTGTEFDVIWQDEQLDLVMQSGTVSVRGPLTPQGIALHGGQHLTVDIARGELNIAEPPPVTGAAAPAPPPSSPPATRLTAADPPPPAPASSVGSERPPSSLSASPTASAGASAPTVPAPGAPERSVPGAPSFREHIARGEFAAVITEAEARGIDVVLDTGSLADVAALADAARYAGKADLARRALLAERSRFAGSAEARSAAFLLGRMAEAGSPAAAVGWYDTYLVESPQGSLAPEALGRKMVAVKASSSAAAARPFAEAYLRRYPRGAFAEAAGEILAAPTPAGR
jgi:FecR protein